MPGISRTHEARNGEPVGLVVIGVYKLFKAALVVAVGLTIIRLRRHDLAGTLLLGLERFRLDPDNRFVQDALARLSGISPHRLGQVGAGLIVYGALYVIEGVGLILRKRWAEYLVVVATSLLIPFEVYELARKPTAVRLAALLANLAIVGYLVAALRRTSRSRGGSETNAASILDG